MGGIIMLCILAYVLIFGVCAGAISLFLSDNTGLSFFNPKVLYKYWQVNWFGAYFLGILFSVLFAPLSILYWIYKLCTIGRK